MTCTHCNKNLPDGLTMCFHCGEPLETPARPEQLEIHRKQSSATEPGIKPAGFVCPHCSVNLPDGLTACFHCGKPLGESLTAQSELALPLSMQKTVRPIQTGNKRNGLAGIVTAAVLLLLLGGAAGGHFLGFYTLPFLPEQSETGEKTPSSIKTMPGKAQPDAPAATTPGVTQPQPEDPGRPGEGVLNRFGYADLTFSFKTESETVTLNPGAVGEYEIGFALTGDTSNVAAVLTTGWRERQWEDDEILWQAESLIPVWKQNGVIGSMATYYPGLRQGFPVMEDELGTSVNVLLLVLGADYETLGHIIIPVTIPSKEELSIITKPSNSPSSENTTNQPALPGRSDSIWDWGDAYHLRGNDYSTYFFEIVGASNGSVWGNGVYSDDSDIATAAVHAGLVEVGQSATVTIRILPGLEYYEGTTRNGITTFEYGIWEGSYEFIID